VRLKGEFTTDNPIRIRSYTALVGFANITKANSADCNMIEGYDAYVQNIVIRDLTLEGNADNNAVGHGIYFKTELTDTHTDEWFCYVALLDNLDIDYNDDDGIHLDGTSGSYYGSYVINNVQSRTNKGNGVYLRFLTDVYVTNCFLGGGNTSAYIWYCSSTQFMNNYFGGASGDANVYVRSGSYVSFTGFVNDASKKHGFYFEGGWHHRVSDGRISDIGKLTNNTYDGIFLEGGVDHSIFEDIMIYSEETNKHRYCIYASDAESNYCIFGSLLMTDYQTAGLRYIGANCTHDADSIIGSVLTS